MYVVMLLSILFTMDKNKRVNIKYQRDTVASQCIALSFPIQNNLLILKLLLLSLFCAPSHKDKNESKKFSRQEIKANAENKGFLVRRSCLIFLTDTLYLG